MSRPIVLIALLGWGAIGYALFLKTPSAAPAQQQIDVVKKAILVGWKCRDINLSIEGCTAMAVGNLQWAHSLTIFGWTYRWETDAADEIHEALK